MQEIKKARKAAKMTQDELAERIGINRATLSKYENGQIEPSMSQLEKIANELNCSIVELLPYYLHPSFQQGLKHGFGTGYDERTEEFREEVNFACDELQRRKDDPQYFRMLLSYDSLNDEGQQRVVEYAEALAATGNYKPAKAPEAVAVYGNDGTITKARKPPQGNQTPNDSK